MNTRYQDWKNTIEEPMKDLQNQINNMVLVQNYMNAQALQDFLSRVDDLRQRTEAEIIREPVTDKESCDHLHATMSRTKNELAELLTQTRTSIPKMLQAAMKEK